MRVGKKWTNEEIELLQEKWGTVSIKTLSKNFGRSENAIMLKANRVGCCAFLESGDYLTFNQLVYAYSGGKYASSYKETSWIKNRKLPVKQKKVRNNYFKIIYLEDWWKWAYENISFLDFSNMEENVLGKEPEWVKAKRKLDQKRKLYISSKPWSDLDDSKLKSYLSLQKYSYLDMQKMLHRTAGAIQRRCCDLGLKDRPVKADNHTKWSEYEKCILIEMILAGANYEDMTFEINRSGKAIRGHVGIEFGTESLDKARKILRSDLNVYGCRMRQI